MIILLKTLSLRTIPQGVRWSHYSCQQNIAEKEHAPQDLTFLTNLYHNVYVIHSVSKTIIKCTCNSQNLRM